MIKLEETPNGFIMVNELLNTSTEFTLSDDKRFVLLSKYVDSNGNHKERRVSFNSYIETYKYISRIMNNLMDGYKARNLKPLASRAKMQSREQGILASVVKKYSKMWGRRIASQIRKLQASVEQSKVRLEQFVFSTVGPKKFADVMRNISICNVEDRDRKYFEADLLKYRAIIYSIAGNNYTRFDYNPSWIKNMTEGANVFAKQTLMALPGALRSDQVERIDTKFRGVSLPKILSSIELKYFLVSGKFFQEKDIRSAAKLYVSHTRIGKVDFRKNMIYQNIVIFVSDYVRHQEGEHKGSLTGLMRKSIQWHREHRYAQLKSVFGDDKETAKPPLFLMEATVSKKDIVFLDTVAAVRQEGVLMGHCVASYADRAVQGYCYLFHIEHCGEMATVEIAPIYYAMNKAQLPKLTLRQSHGPHNKPNKASKWAERFFARVLAKEYGDKEDAKLATEMAMVGEAEIPF